MTKNAVGWLGESDPSFKILYELLKRNEIPAKLLTSGRIGMKEITMLGEVLVTNTTLIALNMESDEQQMIAE